GGAFRHPDVVRGLDDRYPASDMRTMRELAAEKLGELVFDYCRLPDELDGVIVTQLVECE
ncbi:MAG TPA: hypothetical protein VFC35_02950, partial [Gemmatimonadaceae bacterium]|nr:hypothetical protein [Gemmatimonadaceae bacterium]